MQGFMCEDIQFRIVYNSLEMENTLDTEHLPTVWKGDTLLREKINL